MDKKITIGIAIAIVVAIIAVIGVCVCLQSQADAKYPSATEDEFIGSYFCKSPGGRDTSCTLVINSDYTFTTTPYNVSGTWEKFKDGKWIFVGVSKQGTDIIFTVEPDDHNKLTMMFESTDGSETWKFNRINS